MNIKNFTIKAQEVLQQSYEIASQYKNQVIEPLHVLRAILTVDENMAPYLLRKANVDPVRLTNVVDTALRSLPKVSSEEIYFSNVANQMLNRS